MTTETRELITEALKRNKTIHSLTVHNISKFNAILRQELINSLLFNTSIIHIYFDDGFEVTPFRQNGVNGGFDASLSVIIAKNRLLYYNS